MSGKNTEILKCMREVVKLHEAICKKTCLEHNLSQTELDVMAFLHNNPDFDTARDIVELRMLPKGNVSTSVEALVEKGLLIRLQDKADRRLTHLFASPKAAALNRDIEKNNAEFENSLFSGFTEKELELYFSLSRQLSENVTRSLKRRLENE